MPPKPKKKQQKTARPPEKPIRETIIDTALSLAAQQDWEFVSVRNIADEAEITLSQFYDCFDSRDDIIAAYGRRLDNQVLEAFNDFNIETPVRDLLFDILMERFDLANQDKASLRSIFGALRKDPKHFVINLPQLGASMTRMLEAAGVDAYGWKGAARVAGLTGVMAWVTRTWIDDESPDLSATMSALDKALSRIENFADRFNL